MKSITLKCRVITPMFMAGADGKSVELRPSEFKGMMRWWWRAIRAEDNIDKLRKEEGEIFGGTGRDARKSKVQIRIIVNKIGDSDIFNYQPLPHHKKNSCPIDKSNCKKAFTLKAIKPGKEFRIILTCLDASMEEKIRSLAHLVFILGGFGRRSRRGFGSVEITESPLEINIDNILSEINKISDSYKINTSSFISGIQVIKNKKSSGANYPWIKEIILSNKSFNSYDNILNNIGSASHKHSDPSLGSANPRMASPVYVSVVKIGNTYYPIITILNNAFPTGYRYNLNKQIKFIEELL